MTSESTGAGEAYIPPQRIGFKTLSTADSHVYEVLAQRALELLGVHDYTIERLVCHSNVTAKIGRPGLPPLALRIRTGPSVSAVTEMTWLTAVRTGTRVFAIEPFKSHLNENTVHVAQSDGTAIECSLFVWAEGEPLAAHLVPQNYRSLGVLSAELHNFALTWSPPPGLNPLRWDRTMYYEGTRLVVGDPEYSSLISRKDCDTVKHVVNEADRQLAQIAGLPDPIFLHGNIEMWNVLINKQGRLLLLDFEDVMLGQPTQDIAVTLYYGIERPDYSELCAAFQEGYSSIREWPAPEPRCLDLLMAARATMLLNHVLLTESDPAPIVARLLPLITRAA